MFKIGQKRESAPKPAPVARSLVTLQSQVAEGDQVPMDPPRFALAWRLSYDDGSHVQSEWTPKVGPSIARTLLNGQLPAVLTVVGENRMGCFTLDLATVIYSEVDSFGYIGEQVASNPGVQNVLGIWIKLKRNGGMVKVWRNGNVTEASK